MKKNATKILKKWETCEKTKKLVKKKKKGNTFKKKIQKVIN